jgi:hypothetical protein
MEVLVGTLGFVFGFLIGQIILAFILRDVTREELITNKKLARRYGLLNWVIAFGVAALSVQIYLSLFG